VLVEATAGEGVDLQALFETGLAGAGDAAIAANEMQAAAFWRLRESISEAQKKEGASIKHDISVPVPSVPAFIARAVPEVLKLAPGARPVSFGHLGDGNLHFNFSLPKGGDAKAFLALWEEMQLIVHDIVREFGGSISAEHGIGIQKRDALPRYKAHEELEAMRTLKNAFDPKNILNPGKLIPPVLRL
jgi:FAD/FMN-containing dehydrogenase